MGEVLIQVLLRILAVLRDQQAFLVVKNVVAVGFFKVRAISAIMEDVLIQVLLQILAVTRQ